MALSLEQDGVLISTGSACSAKKAGNRILESMGIAKDFVIGSVRLSFSAYDDFDENYVAQMLIKHVVRFKKNIKR